LQPQPIYEALSEQMGVHLPGHGSRGASGKMQVRHIMKPVLAGMENEPAPRSNTEEFPHVHPDHSLSFALERMGADGLKSLPVVSRADIRQVLGVVLLDDILAAYGVHKVEQVNE